ncbi:3'-5' exoribonuclease [Mesorhizobium sp. M0601]|uniref:3'-5' exoribonuclease domain-containing protein n=1 Tax=Mesorhizobium sp. M0601 TaxID=2956969 RepID=UPI00333B28FC
MKQLTASGDELILKSHGAMRQNVDPDLAPRTIPLRRTDVYFSADVETDGPIPGPFSMLSFAIVYAGRYDGERFERPVSYDQVFYRELSPISDEFQIEALKINGLDRNRLVIDGDDPVRAMSDAFIWIKSISEDAYPVLVAYPLSFDWNWLYWYFMKYSNRGSPFDYSRCFDIKTAFAVKSATPIAEAGRSHLPINLASSKKHTHHAIDDAIEQAEIFANIFEWEGINGGNR